MGQWAEPDVADFENGARKLATYGSLLVSLAGGEPLLRTDLPQIVSAIGKYHFPLVTTNGWLVRKQTAKALMEAGMWGISVSIDYSSEAEHDRARGMVGAWEQAWRAVKMLCQARVHKHQRVNVIAVLMKDNLDQLDAIASMAADQGAYFMVQPYGFRKTGSTSHAHNDGQVSPTLVALRAKHGNFLSNPCYLERFDEFLDGGIPNCRAGRAFFNIDSTGDIAICVDRKHKPLANLYRNSPGLIHRQLQKASRENGCTDCWYNCRGEVENLYSPRGLIKALPTLFNDRGRASAD